MSDRVNIWPSTFYLLLDGAVGVFFVWLALMLLTGRMEATAVETASGVAGLVLWAAFPLRDFQPALVADESGVLVRGKWQTRRFGWSDIEDFRIVATKGSLRYGEVVQLLVRNGDIVTAGMTSRFTARGRALLGGYLKDLRAHGFST